MAINDSEYCKRLGIFAYYDKNGVVDDYVIFLLRAMREHCIDLTVVINGFVTPENEARVKKHCTKIIYRDNVGFDAAAYKQAFKEVQNLENYDEIVFFNQTLFGPVQSLHTMFNAMSSQKKLDFWSLSRQSIKADKQKEDGAKYYPDKHFIVVKRSFFNSEQFLKCFDDLDAETQKTTAASNAQSADCERFAINFAGTDFAWGTYLNTENLSVYSNNPMIDMPMEILKLGSPFFKRKSLLHPAVNGQAQAHADTPLEIYNYIRTSTEYPVKFINKNLFRTLSPAVIQRSLPFLENPHGHKGRTGRTAAVFWFAKEEMGEVLCVGAANIQRDVSLLCLFASAELKEKFAPKLPPKTQCIVTEENGFSHLFGKLWKNIYVFENVLYCHNNLSLIDGDCSDAQTLRLSLNSLIPQGCGAIFNERKDIGAFVAPSALGDFLPLGTNWHEAAAALKKPLESAGINVPLSTDFPGAPVKGGMFFARTKAVSGLSKFDFDNSFFEGLLPYYEYLIPIAVQNSEHHTAFSCTQEQAYFLLSRNNMALRDIIFACSFEDDADKNSVATQIVNALNYCKNNGIDTSIPANSGRKFTLKQKISECAKIISRKSSK